MRKMENKQGNKEKKRNPLWNLFKEEWTHLGNRKKIFWLYAFMFFVAGVISLLNPLLIGLIFNSIQQTISSEAELKKLIFMIFLLLVLNFGFWVFHGTARIIEQITGFYVHRNYANKKIFRVLELPVKWHKDNHSGDTIDKINRGRNALDDFSSATFEIFEAFFNIFGSLIILFFIDVRIAIFALCFSVIVIYFSISVDKRLTKYYKKINKFSNKLAASIYDYLSNIMTVITLRLKKIVSKEVDERIMASFKTERKVMIINESKWAAISMAISLMTVLALSYRAYADYYSTGIILVGTLYMLYGYLNRVGQTFYQLAYLYSRMVRYNARIEGAYPIDEEFEKIEEKIRDNLPNDWKEVELKNINFTYDESCDKSHLRNVDMKFSKGQKIALIGESGSGKSTILAIMRGLYPVQKGEVYCDKEKLENGFEKLKRNITLIPQDPEIFNNTIKYNITMDLPSSKEEVEKVIEMAQFKKVLDRLDKGLETNVLEKGVSLSGGEKQRLALARGLFAAKNGDIILLDEPTSSVDSLNEMKIHDNMFKNFKDKTIISSIHRLHLLNKFDYIYMFDKGKIIAEGNLAEMKKNYKFRYLLKKYGLKKEIK